MTQLIQDLQRPDLFREQALVGGTWMSPMADRVGTVHNPATGQILGNVPKLEAAQVREAIAAAANAWHHWRSVPAKSRANILRRWFELIIRHQQDLARILTSEQGKPLTEAVAEIGYAASFIEWFAEEAKRISGDILQAPSAGQRILTIKQPVGVCAAITPWNFPAAMVTRKVGPALAAGCPIVLKPASATPFTALALAVLAEEAGVPPGVFSVVTGSAQIISETLLQSPQVRKLTFTGSTEVGKTLMRGSADTVKKLSLELGGNAPFIVFEDADLEAAANGLMASKFRNAGQTCVCANRVLVQSGVFDRFSALLEAKVNELKVGAGDNPDSQIGPLINEDAVRQAERLLEDARQKGAVVSHGGNRHALGGNFFEPTVVRGVTPDMLLFREEAFAPIAPLTRFDTESDAIALANATEYGLAAYFYTKNVDRVFRVYEAIESGMVGINTGAISSEVTPFGGIKESGIGREGSRYGIGEYLEIKAGVLAGAF